MTQPTVIYFGPDAPRGREGSPPPKVYLRTLLFATSKRGRVIESMQFRSVAMKRTKHSTYGFTEKRNWRGVVAYSSERPAL